jgi:methyltransferase family protein
LPLLNGTCTVPHRIATGAQVGLSGTRFSFDRKLTDYSKVQWLISSVLRWTGLFRPEVAAGAYLNVGCGPNIRQGFVNIDYNWKPGVDICCDIGAGLPVRAGGAGGIFTEHCLEHLSLDVARKFLTECHRVLAPGGMIRIIVPDLEMYGRAYVEALDGKSPTLPNEYFVNHMAINRPVALINELFYGPTHRFMYDFATLAEVLREAGFGEITKCSFGQGVDEKLLIDDKGHISESLYAEARKALAG